MYDCTKPPPAVSAGTALVVRLTSAPNASLKYDGVVPPVSVTLKPSTRYIVSPPDTPCPLKLTTFVISEPPTSGVVALRPGASDATELNVLAVGSASITVRCSTCVRDACCTSTI